VSSEEVKGTGGVYGRLTNYGDLGFSKFIRRAFLSSAGLDSGDIDQPVVGIVNTTSDYTICHREMPQMIEAVKRGVLKAGGIPFVFPVMTGAAFRNAIIHLTAIARRLGLGIDLDDFHELAQQIPVLVNCKPTGSGYLPDMHRDGGVAALLKTLESALNLDVLTVTGQTLREQLAAAEGPQKWQDTIRRLDDPLKPPGALVTLRGSLAPQGAVIKAAAAFPHLMVHEGIAHVFDSLEEVEAKLDDESLGLTSEHVLVMRNIGPVAAGTPRQARPSRAAQARMAPPLRHQRRAGLRRRRPRVPPWRSVMSTNACPAWPTGTGSPVNPIAIL
jgi:dihydroxyacid dehydratase/phosphogluconate dehydratase